MDWGGATSGAMIPLVIAVAAWIRSWLADWLPPAKLTRLMPVVVIGVSLAMVLAGRLLPVPAHGVAQSLFEVAAGAMAGYSGTKAVAGLS